MGSNMRYDSKFNKVKPYVDYKHPGPAGYVFTTKIGDGSASKIYKCTKDSDTYIAKRIHKREEWKTELAVLRSLSAQDSERILKMVEYFISDRYVYLVTKYYGAHDLFDHIDSNVPLPEDYALTLFREMANCVRECHDMGIAHLDIKCENFMVISMNPPKLVLIDFGHAEYVGQNELVEGYTKYGTCFYLCPEGYDNYYSMKSDIWSLGICLYLFLTGDYPFEGDDDEYEENVRNYDIIGLDASPKVQELIARCLAQSPRDRPDIGELCSFAFE
jgi:serine/threonine protein kinase